MELIRLKDFSNQSKADLQSQGAGKAVELIDAGMHDAVVLTVQARKVAEYISAFIKELDSSTRAEVAGYDKSEAEIYGAKLALGSTGDRYDLEADEEYSLLKKALDERGKWLKIASKNGGQVVVDGAVVKPVPIKSASKEVLRIRL